MALLLALMVVALGAFVQGAANVCDIRVSDRFDCDPDASASEKDCINRGCCWQPVSLSTANSLNTPYCYFTSNFGGYEVTSEKATATGVELSLALKGNGSHYGNNVKQLKVLVAFDTKERVHVKIIDANSKRYEVPIPVPKVTKAAASVDYLFKYTTYPFGFAVIRKETGTVIFNSSISAMLYADQFLQISTLLPSSNIYGLGEHVLNFKLKTEWTKLTMFARDVATPKGGFNLYGVHPFYLNVEDDGHANGVLLLNSNAMDVILQPTPAVTYRTIGGVLDFYIITGSSPSDVAHGYQQLVGLPTMPPYWSLGFHLCRWGYKTADRMKEIVDRVRQSGIPQDVQWNDIDYMDGHLDFTMDKDHFHGLPAYVRQLHEDGMHYVVIMDPAISSVQSTDYKPYTDGLAMDVFIKDHAGKPIVGRVWPGDTVFPDFFHPNASAYWTQQLNNFHQTLQFDGLWIDMNEPSNFVDGSLSGCPQSSLEEPPYTPAVLGGSLKAKTICMTATQHPGRHYDLHSLYGYSEGVQTMNALQRIRGQRSLVIGRSTYVGSGGHQGHWLGDNHSTWSDMAYSIAGILNFNLFGIPLVGADICGFMGDTTEELCARWMQLGAFYPFSRNHNTIGAVDQDPAAFGDLLKTASRGALMARYSLLPYLYTLFYDASVNGTSVARPLFFVAPKDPSTLGIDTQFMWGSGLLISPVLAEGAKSVTAYFPEGSWFDYHTGEAFVSSGSHRQLNASFENVNLHVRGGTIIPMQKPALTTAASRRNGFGLFVAPASDGAASGALYLDNGETLDFKDPAKHSYVEFTATQGSLLSRATVRGYHPQGMLDFIDIYGVEKGPSSVLVNGSVPSSYQYDAAAKKLSISNLKLSIIETCKVSWK